jgi:hypothetical protein
MSYLTGELKILFYFNVDKIRYTQIQNINRLVLYFDHKNHRSLTFCKIGEYVFVIYMRN